MPLARQLSNPGSNGSNVRWDVRGLQRLDDGSFTDGQYRYREDGLSYDRPDMFTPGLPAANENYLDWWAKNPNGPAGQRNQSQERAAVADPITAPVDQQSGMAVAPARVLDRDNPRAVAYAQMRLEQLRRLGVEFEELEDPTATWRRASQGITALAQGRGYQNPRDFLAAGDATDRRFPTTPAKRRPLVKNNNRVVRRPGVGRYRVD